MTDKHFDVPREQEHPREGDVVVLRRDTLSTGRIAAHAQSGLMDERFPFKYEERYMVLGVLPAEHNQTERRLKLARYIEPTTVAGTHYPNDNREVYTVTPPISLFKIARRV